MTCLAVDELLRFSEDKIKMNCSTEREGRNAGKDNETKTSTSTRVEGEKQSLDI